MEEPLLYSPTKGHRSHGRRSRKGSDASLWSSRTFSAKSRSISVENNLNTTVLLKRRNTFVIDTVAQEDSILNDSHGLKALLSKKGHKNFEFPPEVKAYINSHFRMIREENLRLSQSLEKANNQLKELKKGSETSEKAEHEDLKSLKNQLEREKAKNKAMIKRLRHSEGNSNHDVIWMQQNNNELENNPRPSTTIVSAKGDPMDRKVKLLNKTVKNLRMEIAELQRENYTMRKVRFCL